MKKKTMRIAGILCLLSLCVAGLLAYKMYNKPHRSAATETAVAVTALQLAVAYEKEEASANKQYLGKAIQVSGTVSDVSVNQQNKPVVLLAGSDMSSVQCTLEESAAGLKKGDAVTLRGFCAGYLTDVIMDRCILSH